METNEDQQQKRKIAQISQDASASMDEAMVDLIEQRLQTTTTKRQKLAAAPNAAKILHETAVPFASSELWYKIIGYAIDSVESCRTLAMVCKGLHHIVTHNLPMCLQHLRMSDMEGCPTKLQALAGVFEMQNLDMEQDHCGLRSLFKICAAASQCQSVSLNETTLIGFDFEEHFGGVEDSDDAYPTLVLKYALCRYLPNLQHVHLSLAHKGESISKEIVNHVTTLFCYKPYELFPNLTSLSFSSTLDQLQQMLPVISSSSLINQLNSLKFVADIPTRTVLQADPPQFYLSFISDSLLNFTKLKQVAFCGFFNSNSVTTTLLELVTTLVFRNKVHNLHLFDDFHFKVNGALVIQPIYCEVAAIPFIVRLLPHVKEFSFGSQVGDDCWSEFIAQCTSMLPLKDLQKLAISTVPSAAKTQAHTLKFYEWLFDMLDHAPNLEELSIQGGVYVNGSTNAEILIEKLKIKCKKLHKLTVSTDGSVANELRFVRLQYESPTVSVSIDSASKQQASCSQYNSNEKALSISTTPTSDSISYLRNFSTIEQLEIKNVQLNNSNFARLCDELQYLHNLSMLSLENSGIRIDTHFASALQHTPQLKRLNLSSNNISTRDEAFIIRTTLIKHTPLLQGLYLADTDLRDEEIKILLFNLLPTATHQVASATAAPSIVTFKPVAFAFNNAELLWNQLQHLQVIDLAVRVKPSDVVLTSIDAALVNHLQTSEPNNQKKTTCALKYLILGSFKAKDFPYLRKMQYFGNAIHMIAEKMDELPQVTPYFMSTIGSIPQMLYFSSTIGVPTVETKKPSAAASTSQGKRGINKKQPTQPTTFDPTNEPQPLPPNTYYLQLPLIQANLQFIGSHTEFQKASCWNSTATGNSWQLADKSRFALTSNFTHALSSTTTLFWKRMVEHLPDKISRAELEKFHSQFDDKHSLVIFEVDKLLINEAGFSVDNVDFTDNQQVVAAASTSNNEPYINKNQYYFGSLIVLIPSENTGGDIVFDFKCTDTGKVHQIRFNKNSIPVPRKPENNDTKDDDEEDPFVTMLAEIMNNRRSTETEAEKNQIPFPCIAVPKGTKCRIEQVSSGVQCLLTFKIYSCNNAAFNVQLANSFFSKMDQVCEQLQQHFEQEMNDQQSTNNKQHLQNIEPVLLDLCMTNDSWSWSTSKEVFDGIGKSILNFGQNLYIMQHLTAKFSTSIMPITFVRKNALHYPFQYIVKNLYKTLAQYERECDNDGEEADEASVAKNENIGTLTVAMSDCKPFTQVLSQAKRDNGSGFDLYDEPDDETLNEEIKSKLWVCETSGFKMVRFNDRAVTFNFIPWFSTVPTGEEQNKDDDWYEAYYLVVEPQQRQDTITTAMAQSKRHKAVISAEQAFAVAKQQILQQEQINSGASNNLLGKDVYFSALDTMLQPPTKEDMAEFSKVRVRKSHRGSKLAASVPCAAVNFKPVAQATKERDPCLKVIKRRIFEKYCCVYKN